jgi:alkanesulfonate monooxygenase
VRAAVGLAEVHGWQAILIYTDNKQIDPWTAAHLVLSQSKIISPLVAVQPLYAHPVAVAKAIASLSILYDRPVHINYVTGGLPRDLSTLCDSVKHDERYERLREYGSIVRQLITQNARPVSFTGRYFSVEHLEMFPSVPRAHQPFVTMSGSSAAGLECAKAIGARAIQYLKPRAAYSEMIATPDEQYGIRVGIIARETREAAWEVAHSRFPKNPDGAELRAYFSRVSDSVWVRELNEVTEFLEPHPYWLSPFKNGQAAAPYLIGDIETVALELAGYMKLGLRTFLLESPQKDDDAKYINSAFRMAKSLIVNAE